MRTFDSNTENTLTVYMRAFSAEMEQLGERLYAARKSCPNKEDFDARMDVRMKAFHEATEFLDYWDLIYMEALTKTVKAFLDSEQPS